ncbi:MAG: DUF2982 domain-containing protein [Plesiomonas sp.]|uniref:DUF2982 domain-containing protein n=1 Tax=Plesiomonas sp. TaxID=2486279 RepID=UPI003F34699E
MESVHMRPSIKKHCITLLCSGSLLAVITAFLLYTLQPSWLWLLSLFALALYLAWQGITRWREPNIGLTLSDMHLQYHHRSGGWAIPWQQVQRIGIPCHQQGLQWVPINYLGIQLKNQADIIDRMTPALIYRLLREQSELVDIGLEQENLDEDVSTQLYNATTIEINQRVYCDEEAMLLHRMQLCRRLFGYDLYIPLTALDRSADQVIALSRIYRDREMRELSEIHEVNTL